MHALRPSPLLVAVTASLALASFHVASAQEGTDAKTDPDAQSDQAEGADSAATDTEPAPTGKDDIDVDALRQEYLKLRDQLFRSRARAAAVATALYSTRISIGLDYTSARFYDIDRATIRLDGANVYDNSNGAIANDKTGGKTGTPRFEGFIAPGRHVVTMRIEATGKDDQRFTSTIEDSFVVEAVAGKDLEIRAKARDDGNIPYQWKKKESGSYKLHLDVRIKTLKRGGKGDGRIQRASK